MVITRPFHRNFHKEFCEGEIPVLSILDRVVGLCAVRNELARDLLDQITNHAWQ